MAEPILNASKYDLASGDFLQIIFYLFLQTKCFLNIFFSITLTLYFLQKDYFIFNTSL
jgi:hypothetical protein